MAWWSSRIWSSSPGPGRGTSIWAPGTPGTYGWILTRCCCVPPCCVRMSAGWQRGCGSTRSTRYAGPWREVRSWPTPSRICSGLPSWPAIGWPGETARYHLPAVPGGIDDWRVGVVDNAVNAGTAVVACLEELRGRGAVPVAVATLVSLGEASTMVQARMRVPFYPASTVPSRAWPAERCPLCAEGAPYTDPLSGDVVSPLPDGSRHIRLSRRNRPAVRPRPRQALANLPPSPSTNSSCCPPDKARRTLGEMGTTRQRRCFTGNLMRREARIPLLAGAAARPSAMRPAP